MDPNASKGSSRALSFLGLVDQRLDLAKQQERRIHLRALNILVTIVDSLVKFCRDHGQEEPREPKKEHTPVVVLKNPLNSISLEGAIDDSSSDNSTLAGGDRGDEAARARSQKKVYKQAIDLFNTKPNKGMQFLIKHGFVNDDAESIAQFFLSTPELSKKMIGEYIGEINPENVRVMHAFIEISDLSGLEFVDALRLFLQTFRLPGEAQKIDRILEKFADRYCELNPNIFKTADAAYVLAYSIVMLNTDQHSKQVKRKMEKSDFILNNRGINGDEDFPQEFLEKIFDEIRNNEIIMEDEQSQKLVEMSARWGGLSDGQRMEIYRKEVSVIQKKTLLATQGMGGRTVSPFKIASSRDLVRPMFESCAWALMASLSLSFEAALDGKVGNEPSVPELCLRGFESSIKLCCWFHLDTERDAYVSSLAKHSALTHFHELQEKNIKAITLLIDLAIVLGEYLDSSWIHVIKCLSLLDRMQVVVKNDGIVPMKTLEQASSSENSVEVVASSTSPKATSQILKDYVEYLQSQSSLVFLDRIFTNSVFLSGRAIVHFFKAICHVSLDEVGLGAAGEILNASSSPRMYLLQKIVEIAYYNMQKEHRIRFEWSQIWRILQPHFNRVACHPNDRVASYAIDSLRQLGMQFLEREELGQFSTQNEFLKSFEWIIKHNNRNVIGELILNSLSQMITARASRIRSGWKPIFATLGKAAQINEKMAQSGFHIVQTVFKMHFEDVIATGSFVDLVFCLSEFALLKGSGPQHDELVMSSIQMLQLCTNSLVERAKEESGQIPTPKSAISSPGKITVPRINNLPQHPYLLQNGFISEEHFHLSWFPILSQFSRVITESDGVLVRTHTMEILFETIKSSGHLFAAPYWKTISRNVISPIFEDLNDPETTSFKESSSAVLIHGLRLLGQLITTLFSFFGKLAKAGDSAGIEFMFKSVDLMIEMMTKPDEKLASTGQTCFRQFLTSNATEFEGQEWENVVVRMENAFRYTLPAELVKCRSPRTDDYSGLPERIINGSLAGTKFMAEMTLDSLEFEKTVLKCVSHLELLMTTRDFCLMQLPGGNLVIEEMSVDCKKKILDCLFSSYCVARVFNSRTTLRQAIHKRGWVTQLPNLIKQETSSLTIYIILLFRVSAVAGDNEFINVLTVEILELFARFSSLITEQSRSNRDINSFSTVVITACRCLEEFGKLWKNDGALKDALPEIYQYCVKLTVIDNPELRSALIDLLCSIGHHVLK
jgi:brefeldin A-inhibited guanine nucleotide-exchange protein